MSYFIKSLQNSIDNELPANLIGEVGSTTLTSYTPASAGTVAVISSMTSTFTFNSDYLYLVLAQITVSTGVASRVLRAQLSLDGAAQTSGYYRDGQAGTTGKDDSITLFQTHYNISGSKSVNIEWTNESDTSTLYCSRRFLRVLEFKRR